MSDEKFTTAGSILLKHNMPTQASKDAYDIYRPLDKGGMGSMIAMLLKHGGPQSHEHINDLAKTFFNKATEMGASTPLSDYINDSDERQAIIDEYDFKVHQIYGKKGSKGDTNKELLDLTGKYNTKIEKQNLDYLLSKGSIAAKMAKTGARGNEKQLATGTSTPLMAANSKGELVPVVIKSSFAQGMSPAEQLAMSYMGRGTTVLTQLSTALPGALFKKLGPTIFHEVITIDDCGTKNGTSHAMSDAKLIIGRVQAGTNKLIDEHVYRDMMSSGMKTIIVRSSLTCEAHEGVCKKCYGLMGNGHWPDIGENVGVIAAQSISEVLTQAMLSTKHKSTVGERRGNAYEQAANILNNPAQNFKDKATIATLNGTVTKIEKTPLGDYNVFIGSKSHFVPRIQGLSVTEGDTIEQGKRLSTGVVNPRELVALRGLGEGRKYLSSELRDIYGGGLDPRHFDLVAKNLIKFVEIENPGDSPFLPGEKVEYSKVAPYLHGDNATILVDKAEGKTLSRGVLELTPGTVLDQNHIKHLKDRGIDTVHAAASRIKITPIVPGLETAKLLDKNWISRLSFNRLKDTIREAAALSQDSDMHSTDPIAPYIIGNEFGEGENGKY